MSGAVVAREGEVTGFRAGEMPVAAGAFVAAPGATVVPVETGVAMAEAALVPVETDVALAAAVPDATVVAGAA
jgi:hypothetical protein